MCVKSKIVVKQGGCDVSVTLTYMRGGVPVTEEYFFQ